MEASQFDVVPWDAEVELKVSRNVKILSDYEDIAGGPAPSRRRPTPGSSSGIGAEGGPAGEAHMDTEQCYEARVDGEAVWVDASVGQ
ncbi:hypothetical protein [Streptomyces sp. NBC_01244]|uniref:hypothetical protein n=1 Tax=Streptomyces sp. NBC_01244 TaxID=2903797 RepID=UPI002E100660|nr:hypothetical protein OG247_38235 [Streptomyces sp. NBC_01244]